MSGSKTICSATHEELMAKVAGLGCLICRGPAEIHHVRFGQGMSQRASDYLIIPLCPVHHRTGGFGIAIHAGQKQFELQHGSELELLAQTIKEITQFLNNL